MKKKTAITKLHEYDGFESPYSAIAVMIFVQAVSDLKLLGGRERISVNRTVLSKWEIAKFLKSQWAGVLAGALNISDEELKALGKSFDL